MSQLLRLASSWVGYETFFITTTDVATNQLGKSGRVYVVGESNRKYPLRVFKVLCRCIRIIVCERPNVVISTGASVGCIACFVGKLLGARIIWIDSITNVEQISLSGRMVRYISDLFLVQWPELHAMYPNVEYAGTVV